MKLLVITSPEDIKDEVQNIELLLKEGLEVLHLRKPDWSTECVEEFLKKIAPVYYRKIVVHGHYKLIEKYNLKGIHIRGQELKSVDDLFMKEVVALAKRKNITVSTSMHCIQEVAENKWKFDYIFLSPIFDSISKKGYHAQIEKEELVQFMSTYKHASRLVALGGISMDTIEQTKAYGFSAAALLGAVWKEEDVVGSFRKVKEKITI